MILPSRRSVFLMAGGLPPLLAMLPLYPSLWNWAILWAIVIAGLLLLDFLLMPTPGSLDVAVEVPPILFIGESDPLTLSVQGRSFRRRQDVEVAASFSDHLAPQPRALVHVGPEVIRYEVPLSPLRCTWKPDGMPCP